MRSSRPGADFQSLQVVVCGCGAAGFTCAKYFVSMGVKKENLIAVDVAGVVYQGREDLTEDNYLCEVHNLTKPAVSKSSLRLWNESL